MIAVIIFGLIFVAAIVIIPAPNSDSNDNSVHQENSNNEENEDEQGYSSNNKNNSEQNFTIEFQRQAIEEWLEVWDKNIGNFDYAWEVWGMIFDDLSKGYIDTYYAYEHLGKVKKGLQMIKDTFYAIQTPTNLSEENKEKLLEAKNAMISATNLREQAVGLAMEFLEEDKPSTFNEVKKLVEESDAYVMEAAANVVSVQKDLGLID